MSDTENRPDLAARKVDVRTHIDDATGMMQKAASSLLVAHGGALIACLSQLKDYGTNPQLKHIGLIIAAFGIGFIVSSIGYIDVAIGRMKWMLAVFNADGKGFEPMPLARAVSLLYISAGILLLAVLAIVWRFFWL